MEYYTAMKKEDSLPSVTPRVDPEVIKLSEISHTQKASPL